MNGRLQVMYTLKVAAFCGLTILFCKRDPHLPRWIGQAMLWGIITIDTIQAWYMRRFDIVRKGFR